MDQYTETQYDDDLTLGTEDYDDSYYADAEDLFAFAGDDESPINRLRSLVLSIDWEITDEVLTQFNQELVDLKDVWAGEKVNLVYVQALEKISKYIYQKKADAHPNAIKLLLGLYYNLEKIVSDHNLSETEKHGLLAEDVKRFENLKKIIAKKSATVLAVPAPTEKEKKKEEVAREPGVGKDVLLKLKAIVLGIDWEITDQDLADLKTEVLNLEKLFATSRPKLILLQGIGTLGAYIKVKKSNAHADAFKILHLFYDSLEKIVSEKMSLDDEKEILFPAVEKFNEFKSLLGSTISPDAISREEADDTEDEFEGTAPGSLAPALSDYDESTVVGFQEEEEARTLGSDQTVVSRINDFFHDDAFPEEASAAVEPEMVPPPAPEPEPDTDESTVSEALTAFDESFGVDLPDVPEKVTADIALQGVDVEYDDDDEEEGDVVNLLSGEDAHVESLSFDHQEEVPALTLDDDASIAPALSAVDEPVETPAPVEEVRPAPAAASDIALQGVAVETEADDDSDLEALPMDDGGLAPALLDSEEESLFSATSLDQTVHELVVDEELSGSFEDFFGDEAVSGTVAEPQPEDQQGEDIEAVTETPEIEVVEPPAAEVPETAVAEKEAETEEITAALDAFEMEEEEEPFVAEISIIEEEAALEEIVSAADADVVEVAAAEDVFVEVPKEVPLQLEIEPAELEAEPEIAFAEELEAPVALEDTEEDVFMEGEELSLESELDEQIDDIFADMEEPEPAVALALEDESLEEPSAVAVPPVAPEIEETEKWAELEKVEPIAADEEGVVFELFDEGDESVSIPEGEAESADIPVVEAVTAAALTSSAVVAGTLTEDEDSSSEALEKAEVFPAKEEEVEKAPFRGSPDEEDFLAATIDVDESLEAEVDTLFTEDLALSEGVSSPYQNLLGCVESIALELDDKVISGLYQEINGLRQQGDASISEKMLLQLLSTVTQHIDMYRYEASGESFNLLKSISSTLAENAEEEESVSLAAMMTQTVKVLQWQQDMLRRQAVVKGEALTFSVPLRQEEEDGAGVDAQQEFDSMLDRALAREDGEEAVSAGAVVSENISETRPEGGPEELGSVETESVAEEEEKETGIRAELARLRKTLQEEIAQLRKDLFKK